MPSDSGRCSRWKPLRDLKVEQVFRWRTERLNDGALFHGNPDFSRALRDFLAPGSGQAASDRVRTWLDLAQRNFGYDRVFLFGPDGSPVLSLPEIGVDDPVLVSGSDQAFLDRGSVEFYDFYRNPIDSRIYLCVMAPVGESPARGVLALRIDPERQLYPIIHDWPVHSVTSETLLVRREDDEVVFLNPVRFNAERGPIPAIRPGQSSELPCINRTVEGEDQLRRPGLPRHSRTRGDYPRRQVALGARSQGGPGRTQVGNRRKSNHPVWS